MPHINHLPVELFDTIIREYSTVSVDPQRNSPMNFLLVCFRWTLIGRRRQHLFTSGNMYVSGHDEVQQLLALYRNQMFPLHVRSLLVRLTPTIQHDVPKAAAMSSIYQDLDGLRSMLMLDYGLDYDGATRRFRIHNLDHFSLNVDLSAISPDQLPLFRGFTKNWVSRISQMLRERQWRGGQSDSPRGFRLNWER